MKKFLPFFFYLVKSLAHIIYLIVAAFIIFHLAYLLGFTYLQDVKGTDSLSFLTFVFWFDKWFPQIPYWYPLHNGGVIPLWGYPLLSHFLVIIIHRLSGLNLVNSFQLLGLVSVPLTALGLYLFVWLRLKNQTIGLIAAVLYVLAPISWAWLYLWGFAAETISYIFIFPTLIFYDYFLESRLKKNHHKSSFARLSLVLAVISLGLTFLIHPLSFFMAFSIAAALTVYQVFKYQPKPPAVALLRVLFYPALLGVLTILLISFIFINFINYNNLTSVGPSTPLSLAEFSRTYPTPVKYILGLEKIPPTNFQFGHRDFVVPFAAWIPAIFGLIIAFFISRKIFVLGLLAFIPILFFSFPALPWFLQNYFPPSFQFIQNRSLLYYLRLLMPIIGAFGIWSIFKIIFISLTFWIKKENRFYHALEFTTNNLSNALALLFALLLIIYFANKPSGIWSTTQVRYGPETFDIRAPFDRKAKGDQCAALNIPDEMRHKACFSRYANEHFDVSLLIDQCKEDHSGEPLICVSLRNKFITPPENEFSSFFQDCLSGKYPAYCARARIIKPDKIISNLLSYSNWPRQKTADITSHTEGNYLQFVDFIKSHKSDKNLRIDISPAFGTLVETLNIDTQISQISMYIYTLSLLGPYWGYEQQVLYTPKDNTVDVDNIAQYFGIKYLLMDEKLNPVEKYKKDTEHWRQVDPAGAWEFLNAPQLYSWSQTKPAALLIGSQKVRAYEPFFRSAVNGAYSYDDGILVQGKENIDDYSLSELKQFNAVILYGYSYKNRSTAFSLLAQYVKEGGSLYIDTGWQYTDKDWQMDNAPEVFPVNSLAWSADQPVGGKFKVLNTIDATSISESTLPSLAWSGSSWGVSIPTNGIRDWAKPVVEYNGTPLVVAGQLGNGKVVWSGLNFPGHIHANNYNPDELKLFNNLLTWLAKGDPAEETSSTGNVTIERPYPDKVTFNFNSGAGTTSTFYWRESEFPDWRADITFPDGSEKPLNIYRAGPGFMLLRLPPLEKGSTLTLRFSPGILAWLGLIISILTLILLVLYCLLGEKFTNILIAPFKPLFQKKHKVKSFISKQLTEDEEDY